MNRPEGRSRRLTSTAVTLHVSPCHVFAVFKIRRRSFSPGGHVTLRGVTSDEPLSLSGGGHLFKASLGFHMFHAEVLPLPEGPSASQT